MKKLKRISIFCLAAVMALSSLGAGPALAAGAEAELPSQAASGTVKSEVVYAVLEADGKVDGVYVVNHFESVDGEYVNDFGAYLDVKNLSDTREIKHDGASAAFLLGENESFYYQGNLGNSALPWKISVSYKLNGKSISADKLSGANGELEIIIKTEANSRINSVYYDNYMLQISYSLDSALCSNIVAPDAVIAEAGANKMLTYTVMPGKDAELSATVDVQSFSLSGIDIAAMPFSMSFEVPDTGEMLTQFQTLADAIAALHGGVVSLRGGAVQLKDGGTELTNGSAEIGDGLRKLGDNGPALVEGSAQIKAALNSIAEMLPALPSSPELGDTAQLSALLRAAMQELSNSLGSLKADMDAAQSLMQQAIAQMPAQSISQEELDALYALAGDEGRATVDKLVASYQASVNLQSTYAQLQEVFTRLDSTLAPLNTSLAALLQIVNENEDLFATITQLVDGIGTLLDGMQQLSANYNTFHDGLVEYTGGVSAVSDGYSEFHSGLAEYTGGVSALSDGIGSLSEGTGALSSAVSQIPTELTEQVDSMLADYLGDPDFEPVSFASEKNQNVELVQFVITIGGISAPVQEAAAAEEPPGGSFLSRLLDLFR